MSVKVVFVEVADKSRLDNAFVVFEFRTVCNAIEALAVVLLTGLTKYRYSIGLLMELRCVWRHAAFYVTTFWRALYF